MRDVKLIDTKNRACAVANLHDEGFEASVKQGEVVLGVRQFNSVERLSMSFIPSRSKEVMVRSPRPECVSDVATVLESAFFFVTGQRLEFDFEVRREDV